LVVLRSREKVTVWIATTEGVSTVDSLTKRTLLIGILEELRLAAELARGAISFRACDLKASVYGAVRESFPQLRIFSLLRGLRRDRVHHTFCPFFLFAVVPPPALRSTNSNTF
jgi:hypothetical protein